jgi:hypothetical protein
MEDTQMNNENVLPFKKNEGLFSKNLKTTLHSELRETTDLSEDQITQVIDRTDSAIAVYLIGKFKEFCHNLGKNIGDSISKQ